MKDILQVILEEDAFSATFWIDDHEENKGTIEILRKNGRLVSYENIENPKKVLDKLIEYKRNSHA